MQITAFQNLRSPERHQAALSALMQLKPKRSCVLLEIYCILVKNHTEVYDRLLTARSHGPVEPLRSP